MKTLSLVTNIGFINTISRWKPKHRIESKRRSSNKKSWRSKSKIKVILIISFDVYHKFLSEEQTVNSNFYLEVLEWDLVRRVQHNLWGKEEWIIHLDNAPTHSFVIVDEFLGQNSITTFLHTPYSTDLGPCDFFLFLKCKIVIRMRHWDDAIYNNNITNKYNI